MTTQPPGPGSPWGRDRPGEDRTGWHEPGPPAGPPPGVPPAGGPRRLRRRSQGAPLGGVCAGIAEYLDVDVTLVRIVAVVLAITGPAIPAYIIAWVVMPDDRSPASARPVPARDHGPQIAGIALLAVGASLVFGRWYWPGTRLLLPAGLIAAGVWLLLRNRTDDDPEDGWAPGFGAGSGGGPAEDSWIPRYGEPDPSRPQPDRGTSPSWPPPQPSRPSDAGTSHWDPALAGVPPTDLGDLSGAGVAASAPASSATGQTSWATPTHASSQPAMGHAWPGGAVDTGRGGSRAPVAITLGILLVWFGIAAMAGLEIQTALAGGLGVVGLGLVVGAVTGRARGLIVPAVVLLAVLASAMAVNVPLRGGIGERFWAPVGFDRLEPTYRLAIGEGTLDLRALDPADASGDAVPVTASIAVGQLIVVVPDDLEVEVTASGTIGELDLLGTTVGGIDLEHHAERSPVGGDGAGHGKLVLDLSVGIGRIEVRSEPVTRDDADHDPDEEPA